MADPSILHRMFLLIESKGVFEEVKHIIHTWIGPNEASIGEYSKHSNAQNPYDKNE